MVPRLYNAKSTNEDHGNLSLHAPRGDALGMESGEDELVGSARSIAAWLISAQPALELSTKHLGRDNILHTTAIVVFLVFSFIVQEGALTLGNPNLRAVTCNSKSLQVGWLPWAVCRGRTRLNGWHGRFGKVPLQFESTNFSIFVASFKMTKECIG
ncbi:hypothetical protein GOP47_0021023 [Adiantum capillus-veneris]|uniref:Uncharacterized protein n=1 Tax=Adiantum capillus-veneris TaxID=13818 RepID=A0A9D4UB91_ADICA|nr:hypothetical protein GOP47_0021023 [Adiantum capillus-veneris]